MRQSEPYDVNSLCLLLGKSRQAYYQGIKYQEKQLYEADLIIKEVMRYRKDQRRIGARKLLGEIQPFLDRHGFKLGRDAFFALLAQRQLLIRKRRNGRPITTHSWHRFKKYPNLIRGFVPSAPNQLWVSDITYVQVGIKFAYLSLITDAYSRKIVGFCLNAGLSAQGPLEALRMALNNNPERTGLIHHSDRGVQYCCDAYIALLTQSCIKTSMTENGDPLENAIAERVNGILKDEFFQEPFACFKSAQLKIAKDIGVYNHQRPHGSIDNLKPAEAHLRTGELKRRWKNYYKKPIGKEAAMSG